MHHVTINRGADGQTCILQSFTEFDDAIHLMDAMNICFEDQDLDAYATVVTDEWVLIPRTVAARSVVVAPF